jgi:hypothetical protein
LLLQGEQEVMDRAVNAVDQRAARYLALLGGQSREVRLEGLQPWRPPMGGCQQVEAFYRAISEVTDEECAEAVKSCFFQGGPPLASQLNRPFDCITHCERPKKP